MAIDANGLYLDRVNYASPLDNHAIIAIRKSDLYNTINGDLPTTLRPISSNTNVPARFLQPVCNFDSLDAGGYTFILGKGAASSGATYLGGAIFYRKLHWTNSVPSLEGDWTEITSGTRNYRDYFDLDGASASAPAKDGPNIEITGVGSQLMPRAMIKNGVLWFCHAVGLSGTSGTYRSGDTVDRSGVQWFRLSADTAKGSLTYLEHGRIYDNSAATNPQWYYFPSLAVNCAGDMVTGFSGSSATNYIGAYYAWRPVRSSPAPTPRLIHDGDGAYTFYDRWGDYSVVVTDPSDQWSFWTVQEYAGQQNPDDYSWRTIIARIKAQP